MIMKSLIQAVAIAAVLAVPVASFAQSNQPVTRAQVRAELVQVEQAGYNPSHGRDPYYPSDIQAAEARVASQNGVAQADATGFGPGASGTTQAGQRAEARASSYSPPVYVIGH
jgi:Tfp pilus assembly protein PilE